MKANLKGLRCLVMGGSGFIGLNLCRELIACGAFVRSFARNLPSLDGDAFEKLQHVEWHCGDFSDTQFVREALRDTEVVFHLVSTTLPAMSNADIQSDLASNVLPTLCFLDLAKTCRIRKVIFVSSGGTIYGVPERVPIPEDHPTNPICAYGIHKLAIEKYLHLCHHLWQLDYGILRLSNPYGIGQLTNRPQGVIAHFIEKAVNGEALEIWGDGRTVRDYIYIDDAINACLSLIGHQGPSRLFNIGSGVGCSLLDLVSIIRELASEEIEVQFRGGRGMDVPINILDVSKAASELAWRPVTDIRAGLKRTFRHAADQAPSLAAAARAVIRD